jgi:hypothetical protein
VGEIGNAYRTMVRKCEGKRQLGDIGIDVRTILKWILKK